MIGMLNKNWACAKIARKILWGANLTLTCQTKPPFAPLWAPSKFIIARRGNPRLRNAEIRQTRPTQKIKSVPNTSIFFDFPASLDVVMRRKPFINGICLGLFQEFLIDSVMIAEVRHLLSLR
jgi:hypothetical protein